MQYSLPERFPMFQTLIFAPMRLLRRPKYVTGILHLQDIFTSRGIGNLTVWERQELLARVVLRFIHLVVPKEIELVRNYEMQ